MPPLQASTVVMQVRKAGSIRVTCALPGHMSSRSSSVFRRLTLRISAWHKGDIRHFVLFVYQEHDRIAFG